MFKQHKTFDLQKERQSKKREKFYQPKKSKYLKYILPPLLVAFILFLILINVNFDNGIYQIQPYNDELPIIDTKVTDQNFETVVQSNGETRVQSKQEPDVFGKFNGNSKKQVTNEQQQLSGRSSSGDYRIDFTTENDYQTDSKVTNLLAGSIKCTSYTANCTLSCSDGSVSYVDEDLELLQSKCPKNDISLMMTKCEFYNGILQNTFFGGSFKLILLSLNECNLQTIKEDAFTHMNVRNLEKLILINNRLITLQASNLEGLTKLKYLEFKQLPLEQEFKGISFLKPMSLSITEITIQPAINSTIPVDPFIWWQDIILQSAIYLDLSHTNIQDILNANTFESFIALESLILFNCNLLSFTTDTFDAVAGTLKYLDLRLNRLTILDVNFFSLMASSNVALEAGLNEWFCECNYELFEIYHLHNNVQFMREIICSAPEKYNQLNLQQLFVECHAMATEVVPDTTASTNITTVATTLKPPTTTSIKADIPTTSTASLSTTITSTTQEPIYPPENFVTIKCFTAINKSNSFELHIIKQLLNFSIYTSSASSVRIDVKVADNWGKISVLYFSSYNDYISINNVSSSNQAVSLKSYMSITDLRNSKAYLYCLYRDSFRNISPYDCQAHVIYEPSWLLQTDKAWFITISTIVSAILFISSLFVVNCLLRRHPHCLLIRSNKSILPVHNRPNKILVVSRKSSKEAIISSNYSAISQGSSKYLKALPPFQSATDYCSSESPLYISQNAIPTIKAPSSPPIVSRRKSTHPTYLPPLSPLEICTSHISAESSLYTAKHTIPLGKAPSLPDTSPRRRTPQHYKKNLNKDSKHSPSSILYQLHLCKLETSGINDYEAIYQTFDHYEAVNF